MKFIRSKPHVYVGTLGHSDLARAALGVAVMNMLRLQKISDVVIYTSNDASPENLKALVEKSTKAGKTCSVVIIGDSSIGLPTDDEVASAIASASQVKAILESSKKSSLYPNQGGKGLPWPPVKQKVTPRFVPARAVKVSIRRIATHR